MFIAKNLKRLRLEKGLTQEELAERVGVTGQAVSKWERGECYPDITLLPGLANLFGVTADELLGMAEVSDRGRLWNVHAKANTLEQQGEYCEAAALLEQALKTFPDDPGLLSQHAAALAMAREGTDRAIKTLERLLAEDTNASDKRRGTNAAVLCYLYKHAGMTAEAERLARARPHAQESRELLLPHFLTQPERGAYLREHLPGVLTAICRAIDGGKETAEEELRTVLLGIYSDSARVEPETVARRIAEFLRGCPAAAGI